MTKDISKQDVFETTVNPSLNGDEFSFPPKSWGRVETYETLFLASVQIQWKLTVSPVNRSIAMPLPSICQSLVIFSQKEKQV